MAQSSYQLINLITDIVLTWPFSFEGGITIADINDIAPDQDGWTIALPNATLASPGQNFKFNNVSVYSFEIIAFDAITSIVTVNPGEVVWLYLYDSTTTNGLWRIVSGEGTNAIVSLDAISSDSSIVITGGNITPPGGTINFQQPTSLFNLNNVKTVGFPIIKATNPLTWKTAELIDGDNIIITNPDGVIANPIINLNPVVTGLSSLQVGDMTFTGSLITSDIVDGNVQINTNGTGKAQINGVEIDVNGNITGINNITITGGLNSPLIPKAWCMFTDTITGPENTIVVESNANIAAVTGAAGTYTGVFATPMPSINYGVIITLGSTGGNLPFISNGYFIVRETTFVTIVVTDASGEPVLSAPNGVTLMILSN